MMHVRHLLKGLAYTVMIAGTPLLVITHGHNMSHMLMHPAYQFFVVLVLAYCVGPTLADWAGHGAGTAIFFPNHANLGHPTISHIITLMNKRLYNEAYEELRMLLENAPSDFRGYKMILSITANYVPDRGSFDMYYRKGMQSLELEEEKNLLKRWYAELVQVKMQKGDPWPSSADADAENRPISELYVNRKHHREKPKLLVEPHSATLPSREQREAKARKVAGREEKSSEKVAVVPHHFHPVTEHHHAPLLPDVKAIVLEKSGEEPELGRESHPDMDSSIEHFVEEKPLIERKFKFVRPR